MREYLAATTAFDYQHTVNAALSGNLQALNAVSYTHLTLPTSDLV